MDPEVPKSEDQPEAGSTNRLLEAARAAATRAYAPYSGYRVGAAVMDGTGAIHAGCNVENASYGLTVCAERNAVGAAVASGATHLTAVAIFTRSSPPATPCGACRQVLSEFAGPTTPVYLINDLGEQVVQRLGDLLPGVFHLSGSDDGDGPTGSSGR